MSLLKPFFVKLKTRKQCLCHWHLQMEFLCAALHNWRVHNRMAHRGRSAKLMCDCPNLYSPHEVRKAVLCPRLSTSNPENRKIPPVLSVDYDKPECTSGTRNFCSEMKLFKICEAELALTRPITFLLESRVEYQTNKKDYDGKWIVKNKVDFVSTTMSITDFMDELKGKMLKFIPHHVDMKWQSRDWRWVKKNFTRGTWACVQDFSENFTVEVALEHQSKYYNTVSVTLFGIVGQ